MIDGDELRKLLQGRRRRRPLPVAALPSGLAQAIDCNRTTVLLSWQTIQKQMVRHPEIVYGDYLLIPHILERGLVVQDSPKSLIIAGYEREPPHRLFRSAVKSDWLADGLFLTSYHIIEVRKLTGLRKRGRILREFR